MTVVLNLLLPVLAGVCLLTAGLFLLRAWRSRRRVGRQVYGVGQVETRRVMQIRLLKAIGMFVLAAVLMGAWGILLAIGDAEPVVTATPTVSTRAVASATPTGEAATATATLAPTLQATLTQAPAVPTVAASPTVSPTPSVTPAPRPPTATVSSEVGVYLRAEPNTDAAELEWVLDGTVLVLLPGRVQGEAFEWQQVRTPAGNEGWVAVPFILFNE
ncbi:MAG: SH3 domain-containing protein [Anaerolineales bacterium]|nr:SH3 domain-containing protein [Anaerolineales bacterium]